MPIRSIVAGILVGCALFAGPCLNRRAAAATEPAAIPSAAEVRQLLQQEPISVQTWPAWRGRLLAWIGDTNRHTDPAYDAARAFVQAQARGNELPPPLADDAFAWYLLGSVPLQPAGRPVGSAEGATAEKALRRSIKLDPNFARAHRNLAVALLLQASSGPKHQEALREMARARQLDPTLSAREPEVWAAALQHRYGDLERLSLQALAEEPGNIRFAHTAAFAVIYNDKRPGPRAPAVKAVLDRFPNDGTLVCLHGAALALDNDARAAQKELDRARSLGVDPAAVLSPELVRQIEKAAAPGPLEWALWGIGGFAGFYAAVMLLMAGTGVILAQRTRGSKALELLGDQPEELVREGQVIRSRGESALARLYSLALFTGLILFYVAIPFLVIGLLGVTALLLYAIFLLPRIPVKLVVLIFVIGGGMAWGVLKSIFTRPGSGSFGIPKTSADCPQVYQVLTEVAKRVDTEPVDEVYLAPGSSIGVHQEGRGPFGVLGVKRRVLTLGLSTMHFLTVSELKAILAHEYAHFSHRDTFYSRFIYQVHLSIEHALGGMADAIGKLNYVNPFYWFLWLYYKAYSLLAAGHSRSREFLADRMASSLYGADVFTSALTKVCTDGTLFEMTIYDNISRLLEEDKGFVNMYEAFRSFRNEQLNEQEREELYQKLLDEKGSLFASHPTFGERVEAIATMPRAEQTDTTSALQLFPNPEEIEKELTDFLTGFMHHVRQLQMQSAQS